MTNKIKDQMPLLEYGKIPPQAVDLEEAVLGAMMIDSGCVRTVHGILKPEYFYKDSHQRICRAIYGLYDNRNPIDILTVTNKLRSNGDLELVGGPYYIGQITDKVNSGANSEFHSRILFEKYMARENIAIASNMIKDAFDDTKDPFTIRDNGVTALLDIDKGVITTDASVSDLEKEFDKRVDDVRQGRLVGIKTGFDKFDWFTGGLQKTDLIIIGSYSSNAKTQTAINWFNFAALNGHNVKFYSFEQSALQLYSRQLSITSEVSATDVRFAKFDDLKINAAKVKLRGLKFSYSESPNHIDRLCSSITKDVVEKGVELVFIDYIQLMESNKKDIRESIGYIANRLKKLAKELNIPIVLISQLRRPNDKQRPAMSMLKESGEQENAADIVLLPWIPINEPTSADTIKGSDGSEMPTTYTVGTRFFKLIHYNMAKGRSYGTTKFDCYTDDSLKIYNELPVSFDAPLADKRIEPNKQFYDAPF